MADAGSKALDASLPPSGHGERILELDGLRGIAVALVILQHAFARPYLGYFARELGQPSARVLDMTWCGVDIFFVLSGFLIGGIILEHRGEDRFYPAFYARRTARIFPAYFLLVALAYIPLGQYGTHSGKVPLLGYLSFTSNLYTSMGTAFSFWLRPLWSVSIEEQFYLLAPIGLRLLHRRLIPWMLGAVIIGSAGLRTATLLGLVDLRANAWDFTLTRLDGLALGVLAAWLLGKPAVVRAGRARARSIGVVFALLLGSCLWLAQQSEAAQKGPGILLLSFTAFVAIALVRLNPASWLSWFLRLRYLAFLGRHSYFLYLFHMPMLWLGTILAPTYFFSPVTARIAVNALAMIALCAIAPLSWRWFEAPLLALGRRVVYGRGAGPAGAQPKASVAA